MSDDREHSLDGAPAIELVVALCDRIMRNLSAAIAAVERGNVDRRRAAVRRALDIVILLQARLLKELDGEPAQLLSQIYAAIFARILQASQSASKQKFEHAIACVRAARDAWRQAAEGSQALGKVNNRL